MQPETKNKLQCWLFDRLYWHLPQDQEPNYEALRAEVSQLERPNVICSLMEDTINTQILGDIATGNWRKPPTPTTKKIRKLFPRWQEWHRIRGQSQPYPTPNSPPGSPLTPLINANSATSAAFMHAKKRAKFSKILVTPKE